MSYNVQDSSASTGTGRNVGSGGIRGNIGGGNCDGVERRMVDITRDKPIKVAVRVQVPVRDHPKFNFVGKLLGPKGNSLKRLQEECGCKMAVLGRGSMKDRQKDYNDDIRQEQMWEMQMMNCNENNNTDIPSSPETSSEPTGSPISSKTSHSADVQDVSGKSVASLCTSSTLGCRKRPGNRPTVSPIKRTVMSLLTRARAVQNKEQPVSLSHNGPGIHQASVALLTSTTNPSPHPVAQVPRIQLIGSSVPQHTTVRRQIIPTSHTQHQMLTPAIHGLIHTQRVASGPAILPLLREDLVAGVNLV
ncbi:uncharacterized protein [Chelonus insularis]|uniref:uncharacterized protein isoform X3 n=1 Tax=Chelonus insularis TaxID=460826 RepID=UPI00158D149C|nr:uncharacterized protein LOC118068624 isoform X3 [Chelonus insularis]